MMIAKLTGVGKEYQVGDQTIVALKPVDLEINELFFDPVTVLWASSPTVGLR